MKTKVQWLFILAVALPTTVAVGNPAKPRRTVTIQLPTPRTEGGAGLDKVLATRRSVRSLAPGPISLENVSQLLWAAQGVTGPGGRRAAPSARATYPLETYLVAGDVTGLPAGVYHYLPADHRLTPLGAGDRRAALVSDAVKQPWVVTAPAIILLAGAAERTREPRWTYVEAGLAAENLLLEAVSLGLGSTFVGGFDPAAVVKALGLPATVEPIALLPVGKPR